MSDRRRFRLRFYSAVCVLGVFCALADRLPAAHPDDPKIKAAVKRGVEYIKSRLGGQIDGYNALCIYALMKAKVPASDPAITGVVEKIAGKAKDGVYRKSGDEPRVYIVAVDIMAMEAADPVKYKIQIEAAAKYLLELQADNGAWDYPGNRNNGDTSITQYALLGLWAAQRAGIAVPSGAWNRGAKWLLQYQLTTGNGNGAFAYHPAPAGANGRPDKEPSHSMTAAASGSLMVARLHLYPNGRVSRRGSSGKKSTATKQKFGILKSIDFDAKEDKKDEPAKTKPEPNGPRVGMASIDGAVNRGAGWLTRFYSVDRVKGLQSWPLYYLYALERMCALAKIEKFGDRDWYADGSAHLLAAQKSDGSWMGQGAAARRETGTPQATSFALLFLTKSTARMLKRSLGSPDPLGSGLQAGGRGLSGDLSLVEEKNGRVEAKKVVLPIDKLLAELENPTTLSVIDVQKAVVENVQIGDREKLIGEKKRLKALTKHPDGEVRRTAFWALGHCQDLELVPLLLRGLEDPDLAVVVEARDGLCVLCRKPRGILVNNKPLPANPLLGLPSGTTAEQKKVIEADWRKKVRLNWLRWYFRSRRYVDRDDLEELQFLRKEGSR